MILDVKEFVRKSEKAKNMLDTLESSWNVGKPSLNLVS